MGLWTRTRTSTLTNGAYFTLDRRLPGVVRITRTGVGTRERAQSRVVLNVHSQTKIRTAAQPSHLHVNGKFYRKIKNVLSSCAFRLGRARTKSMGPLRSLGTDRKLGRPEMVERTKRLKADAPFDAEKAQFTCANVYRRLETILCCTWSVAVSFLQVPNDSEVL
jgi:hypothetical protein